MDEMADHEDGNSQHFVHPSYASRFLAKPIPKNSFPTEMMEADTVKQVVVDMRQLDENPRMNLASYVCTWMEEQAQAVINQSLNVNLADQFQYPSTRKMEARCVAMLGDLWNAPGKNGDTSRVGTSTVGSSEACMLGGLALKRRWQQRRKAEGKPTDKPNLVLGAEAQVCWEKFCCYFEVEGRYVPITEEYPVAHPDDALKEVDENTIGVVMMFGSTYNGQYEDVKGMHDRLVKLNEEKGWGVRIHVDAASAAFVAPFISPDLLWDFRLSTVASINASGHKYGLVYPGIGWVLWRTREDLPDDLVFHINYLGSDQATYTLNFSRNAALVCAQYYMFLRLGREGYTRVMRQLMKIAGILRKGIIDTGHFQDVGDPNKSVGNLPVVAVSLKDRSARSYDEYAISERLREYRWMIPAYTLAPNAESVKMLRIVVREDLSLEMAAQLISDIKAVVDWLDHHYVLDDTGMEDLKKDLRGAARKSLEAKRDDLKRVEDGHHAGTHTGVC